MHCLMWWDQEGGVYWRGPPCLRPACHDQSQEEVQMEAQILSEGGYKRREVYLHEYLSLEYVLVREELLNGRPQRDVKSRRSLL